MIKRCWHCGKKFITLRKHKMFCSKKCLEKDVRRVKGMDRQIMLDLGLIEEEEERK